MDQRHPKHQAKPQQFSFKHVSQLKLGWEARFNNLKFDILIRFLTPQQPNWGKDVLWSPQANHMIIIFYLFLYDDNGWI